MNYLRTLLDDAASAPAPPARVDVDLAVASGTRIVRRRRTVWVVGAASAVVACLVASALVFTPAAQEEPAVPLPQPTFGRTFEPGKKYATFGRLEDQFTTKVVETGPDWHRQWATNGSWDVELRMVTAGRDIELSGNDKYFAVDPAQVDKRWLDRSDPPAGRDIAWNAVRVGVSEFAARWTYAPGAWIEVAVQNTDRPKEVLLQILNEVRVEQEDVGLPVHVDGPPTPPTDFLVRRTGDQWLVSFDFQEGTHVTVDSPSSIDERTWNTRVDGKKARFENRTLAVLEPSGAGVYVTRSDGNPVELYRRVRIIH